MKEKLQKILTSFLLLSLIVLAFTTSLKAQTTITLGSGTNQTGEYEVSPANVYWESRRIQIVYTKSEINSAGITGTHVINALGFNISQVATKSHKDYKIRLGHTTATNAANHISTTLTQVYSASTVSFNATGWKTFNFTTPFTWNGLDNIVVDICWGVNTDYSASGKVYTYSSSVTNGIRTKNHISQVVCSDVTDATLNKKPQARLTFNPPSAPNDWCVNAINLPVHGPSCGTATIGNTAGATNSNVTGGCNGTPNDDIWFKFTAQATSHIITVVGSAGFDAVVDLRSGSCNGVNMICADATGSGGTEVITATGLTIGSVYLVRVYHYWASIPTNTTFTICVTTPAANNNTCANAHILTPQGTTCTSPVTGNVSSATASGVALTCGGSTLGGKDLWYKFNATATAHNITVVGSSGFDAIVQLFSGPTCPGTHISCADNTYSGGTEVINATGLTVGNTYYVRVYDYFSSSTTTTFTICVTTPGSSGSCTTPGPPTNLTVTPTQTSASFTWAAPTNPVGSPTRVYYWLVSTNATPNWANYVARCGDAGGFAGNTNGTGQCAAPSSNMPVTLTPNTQYYLHMYVRTSCDWSQSGWATQAFMTQSTAPVHDNCAGAISLTPQGVSCTSPLLGETNNATQSPQPVGTCGGYPTNDVWYKFNATSTSHTITVSGSGDFDAVIELYQGPCPGTYISCADATYAGGTEVINATGLTVGTTYFVRVFHYYSATPTDQQFNICITTPSATGTAPISNFTASTTAITVGGSIDFTDLSAGNPSSWSWQFAVGAPTGSCTPATSSLQNRTVVYNQPGTYTVRLTATNSFGSDTHTKTAYVIVNPTTATLTATANASQSNICSGSQTQINAVPTGGSGNYTYQWDSNPIGFTSTSQNPTVSPNSSTVYTVTVSDGSQTATTSVTVNVSPLPSTPSSINGPVTICNGLSNVSYFVPTVLDATGYTWTLPAGATIVSGQNTNNIVVNFSNNATAGNITVAGTNACGTGPVGTLALSVSPPPVANAGTNQTIASGGTANLTGSATGGSGIYTYAWTPANMLQNANVQNPITLALTTSQVFTLTVTDDNSGCSDIANVQILITGGTLSASANASTTNACEGSQITLQAIPSGGSGNYTYAWTSNPAGFTSNAQNPTVTPTISTQYLVTISEGGSSATASVSVTVNPLPDAPSSITGTPTACQGASGIAFSVPPVNNATGYLWTLPTGSAIAAGVNTNSILLNFGISATTGTISVVAVNACGNSLPSPAFSITVNPLPAAAGTIAGPALVNQGQTGVSYFVPLISYATNYVWTLPAGANLVSGQNTNSIIVNFSQSAVTGVISVYGSNACGDGPSSTAFPVTIVTDIDEVTPFALNMYPNPTTGMFTIEMDNMPNEVLNLSIFNTMGSLIFETELAKVTKQSFDFSNLSNGMYYLNIKGEKTNKIDKLIIQK